MAFVIHHKPPAFQPTPEEAALVRELKRKGLSGESLESTLVARGVDPARARALARLAGPRSAADHARGLAGLGFWVLVALAIGVVKPLLQRWLRDHQPGSEWLAELVLPAVLGLAVLWTLMSRLRSAGDAPQGTTRADQIDNRPIG